MRYRQSVCRLHRFRRCRISLLISLKQSASSDEQLATSKSHYTTATESVQYPRDVPPSPPLSPQLSPYSQQVVPTTVNQFPPSSVPSIRKSHTTATNIPEIPMRLYPEPRYPTSRSSENHPSMDAPISGVTKIISTEVRIPISSLFPHLGLPWTTLGPRMLLLRHVEWCLGTHIPSYPFAPTHHCANNRMFSQPRPRGPSNHLSATEFPRSPNQASFSHSCFLVP